MNSTPGHQQRATSSASGGAGRAADAGGLAGRTAKVDNRAEIRDFLASRRAKLTPQQVGLPDNGHRRVTGLRREEVAVLAGVSTEWYARLEKGHIDGVSEDVLASVAAALRLDDDEITYLTDLARAAKPAPRARRTLQKPDQEDLAYLQVEPRVQWMLDTITLSAGFVRNGRLDVLAANALGRALHAPLFASPTTLEHGHPNFARFHFLDPVARTFFVDWQPGAHATVALLRAEAGRHPHDRALRELIGELVTLSADFRTLWSAHDVLIRHDGVKRIQHPEVGRLELTYQPLQLSHLERATHEVTIYTAEPGTDAADALKLLASWSASASSGVDNVSDSPAADLKARRGGDG